MSLSLTMCNKGWHKQWFYLKNDPTAPLPIFSGSFIESAPKIWVWGPPGKEQDRIEDHLKAITILRECDLHRVGVIGVYHVRRLVPLMVHALSMYQMTLGSPPNGTVMLARNAFSVGEVKQCLKEATEVLLSPLGEIVPIYPVLGHPPTQLDVGFVET
jgi:hypothetical protein